MSLKTSIDSLIANVNAFIAQLGSLSGAVQQAQNSAGAAAQSAADAVAVVTGGTASLTPAAGMIPLADANGNIDANWLPDSGINARAISQAVHLTYASAGATGFSVANNNNLNMDTNDFGWHGLRVALPDYTPSSQVSLMHKHDGSNGIIWTLETNGKLRLQINGTTYDSTVATGLEDYALSVLDFAVGRSSTSVAGGVRFYVNGAQLGDPVVIAAGAPVTVSNTVPLYVMGNSTKRTAGTVYALGALYNRKLMDSEVRRCGLVGTDFANKYGSMAAGYTSGFSAGADSFSASGAAVAGNVDAISGENDWLSLIPDTAASTHSAFRAVPAILSRKKFKVTIRYYIPATNAVAVQLIPAVGNLVGGAPNLASALTVTGIVTDAVFETETFDPTSTSLFMYAATSTSSRSFTGNGADVIYVKLISLTPIGAMVDFGSSGIQPAQWRDNSHNELHAMFPAAGATLALFKETGQYNWITPITGDTTLTGITPAGYELDKIVFNNSTANAVSVRLGTTAGGVNVFDLTALNTSATLGGFKTIGCNQAFSLIAAQTLYLSSTAWNSASLTATFYFRRVT